MNKRNRGLYLCLTLLLVIFLAACNSPTDEQDSTQPTPSTQPTAEPAPTPPPIPYTDVPEDAPYYDAVVWAYKNGIASDGETFDPTNTCTRGQVLTFLWRAMGSPEPWIMENPFSDASPDVWCYKPALWAYQHNIATGTTVNAGNPCTNAEALTFLWRAEGKPDKLNTLAASGTYYGQPVAWADKNGLITGTEFDPAAPCSRADLMGYLYWVVEEWTPSEEEKKIQTEYDKILHSSSNTPDYADYVDVDGDGKTELLTLDYDYEKVTVALYSDMDSHIEKSCEGVFQEVEDGQNTPEDTFLTDSGVFSLYSADGQLYLCQNRYFYEPAWYPKEDDLYDFYKLGKESITFCEQRNIWMLYNRDTDEEQHGDTGTSLNYTKLKDVFSLNMWNGTRSDTSVLDKGILPTWKECERYWTAYWEASDPIYAALLSGDFSAFAGTYEFLSVAGGSPVDPLVLMDNGAISGGGSSFETDKKPISITVKENGTIECIIKEIPSTSEEAYDGEEEFYEVYPAGVSREYSDNGSIDKVRIYYVSVGGGVGEWEFAKAS